jgi:protoporphyrinogen oxidase
MSVREHIGIVGGGLLGMTVAWELVRRGHTVALFDSAPVLGGLASASQIGGITWDRYYHVILSSDITLRGLLAELDLDSQIRWRKAATGFYWNGRLHDFSTPFDLMRFPLLNPIERLRFGLGILRASRLASAENIQNLTIEEWLTQISGRSTFQKVWLPLLRAKLGDDYRTTSAIFMWATIRRLHLARSNGAGPEKFGYLPRGYAGMLETFEMELRQRGVKVWLNAKICGVHSKPQGVELRVSNGETLHFDRVVITAATPLAASFCPQITGRERERLEGIEYEGVICPSFLLSRPLSPYYVTNIADSSIPLTGVIEMSALVDREVFHGRSLVYLPRYVRPADPEFLKSDEEIGSRSLAALRTMHPSLRAEEVIDSRVSRARWVFRRPVAGALVPVPLNTSVPRLHLINSAQITDGTLNVNETVLLAQQQTERLHEQTV